MQQTDKYQLNLIETSDTFSPAPLNENAQKLEDALEATRAEAAAGDAAQDQRLQVLEARRFAYGTYRPQPEGTTITLGFQPAIVLIMTYGTFLSGALTLNFNSEKGKITDDGFWIAPATTNGTITLANCTFAYVAFG